MEQEAERALDAIRVFRRLKNVLLLSEFEPLDRPVPSPWLSYSGPGKELKYLN